MKKKEDFFFVVLMKINQSQVKKLEKQHRQDLSNRHAKNQLKYELRKKNIQSKSRKKNI